jgi:hypothetical protein
VADCTGGGGWHPMWGVRSMVGCAGLQPEAGTGWHPRGRCGPRWWCGARGDSAESWSAPLGRYDGERSSGCLRELRDVIAGRQRELAVGDREQDGVGRRDRDYDWRSLPRTYLAPFAQAPVVIRRARLRRPSAQQPTASRVCAFSRALLLRFFSYRQRSATIAACPGQCPAPSQCAMRATPTWQRSR